MGRGETGTPEETQRQRQGLGGCSLDAVERKQGLLAASLEAKLLGSLCSEGKGSSGPLGLTGPGRWPPPAPREVSEVEG